MRRAGCAGLSVISYLYSYFYFTSSYIKKNPAHPARFNFFLPLKKCAGFKAFLEVNK